MSFGDGSGERRNEVDLAIDTWSVVRLAGNQYDVPSKVRGQVGGWFPTVPRAELSALLWHLQPALCPATYVGDCAEFIRGATQQVPAFLKSSRSIHADLWKRVAWLIEDHGDGLAFLKTKAHRSRDAAARSEDDPLAFWLGNDAADKHAKSLCKAAASHDQRSAAGVAMRGQTRNWLQHVSIAAAWCFQQWPPVIRGNREKLCMEAAAEDLREHALLKQAPNPWQCSVCLRMCTGT